jgi:hypothetical protein
MPRTWKLLTILSIVSLTGHFVAAGRVSIPSQDGIKFIGIAREFGRQPVWDVVRSADQHPAYPALTWLFHQMIGSMFRMPAQSWMAAARGVSIIAAVATLIPLYLLTKQLFRPTTALLAVFLWLLLPTPFSLGHETLSDATALCFMVWALWLGVEAIDASRLRTCIGFATAAAGSAVCAYWTRPEGLLAAISIGCGLAVFGRGDWKLRVAGLLPFMTTVAAGVVVYLTIHGTISGRLAAFRAKPVVGGSSVVSASYPKGLPQQLRDPRFDFSPKDPVTEATSPGLKAAGWSILRQWSESLGIALAVMTLWGLIRTRARDQRAKRLVTLHAAVMLGTLILQASSRGYLSSRHVSGLTFLSVPFAAAALRLCGLRIAHIFRMSPRSRRIGTRASLAAMALIGVTLHAKPIHASRQPHYRAGKWLVANAPPGSAVFDTRGWASFIADAKRYDPYHFAQAISDSSTKYWIVESAELSSGSKRAFTLSTILADGGREEAVFRRKPDRVDGGDVHVFAWRRPSWWDRSIDDVESDSHREPKTDSSVRRAGNIRQEGTTP